MAYEWRDRDDYLANRAELFLVPACSIRKRSKKAAQRWSGLILLLACGVLAWLFWGRV